MASTFFTQSAFASAKVFQTEAFQTRSAADSGRVTGSACKAPCSLCPRVLSDLDGFGKPTSRKGLGRHAGTAGERRGYLRKPTEQRKVVRNVLQNAEREMEAASDSDEVQKIKKGLVGRNEALKLVDNYLENDDERSAVEIAKALVNTEGGLRAFGTAQQVPQRQYTLQDLRLNKIEPVKFLSPTDSTLSGIRTGAQIALLSGIGSLYVFGHWEMTQLLGLVVALLFVGSVDQIVNGGGGEGLILDTAGNLLSSRYRDRVSQHEAGHFLVSYLVGVLPRAYTLSSLNALTRYGALNVQAGTRFVDFDFQEEVKTGKIQSKTVDTFTCIALAGVATEYIKFGLAEGGLNDINQLDSLLRSLGFSQKKADSQIRWAVLNTVTLLMRHAKAHNALVAAMIAEKTVGECIAVIEDELKNATEI